MSLDDLTDAMLAARRSRGASSPYPIAHDLAAIQAHLAAEGLVLTGTGLARVAESGWIADRRDGCVWLPDDPSRWQYLDPVHLFTIESVEGP